jgi:hypothetical protein
MPIYAIYDYENISGDPDEELKRPLRVIDPLEIADMLHANDLRAMVENSWPGVFFYLDDDGGIRAKTKRAGLRALHLHQRGERGRGRRGLRQAARVA